MFKRTKKTISGVLATLIFVSLFAGVPVFANNISTYIYNGYTVEYFIDAEWQGHQNISVTLINTSDENLVDWALKFDASGDIITIWNGEISENNDTEYIITHADWNREIWAGHRTSFGYIVAGDTLFAPLKFEIGPGFDSGDTSQDEPGEPEEPREDEETFYFEPDNSDNGELFDIGEIYFKDIESDEDVGYDENGISFVRNQLLLTAHFGVSYETVNKLVDELNAEIVGFIELTNDYQLEFNEDVTADFLYQCIDELIENPIVEFVSLNIAFKNEENYMPTDKQIAPMDSVHERNWNLHAINATEAWNKYFHNETKIRFSSAYWK